MTRAVVMALLASWLGAAAHAATLEYIAHASFVIESDAGDRLLIDPYASRVWLGYDFPELESVDAVLVTHPHYDHDAGRYRGRPWPWDAAVEVFDRPGGFTLGDFQILGVEGKHADPWGKEFGQLNTIFRIEVDGLSIVHLGDNGPLTPGNVSALKPVDILMLPADGLEHILKNHEIAEIVAALEPRALVPMHYRIPELEHDADSPDNLGDIDSWLAGRQRIVRLGGSLWAPELQWSAPSIVVFRPSPLVTRPATGE